MRIMWEIQVFLQRRIPSTNLFSGYASAESTISEDARELMMLFITGFPAIKISKVNTPLPADTGDIESQIADVELWIDAEVETHSGTLLHREVQLSISNECDLQEEMRFDWQMWKDAFMGRMLGQREWRITRHGVEDEELQRDAAHSGLNDPVIAVVDADYYFLGSHYWSGWPPCYPRM
eukprot:IDg3564t1